MKVLVVHSSANKERSSTRTLANHAIEILRKHWGRELAIKVRDVGQGLTPINEAYLTGRGKKPEERTQAEKEINTLSDRLVEEIQEADLVVIGAPMYNFSVPSSLKTWFDHIAQAGKTFSYSSDGPKGHLEKTRALVLTSMGGDWQGKEQDFLTGYVAHFLKFLGIHSQAIINAKKQASGERAEHLSNAEAEIESELQKLMTS